MLKASENPPMLFPANCLEESSYGPWWVAHTRSRQEKALAWFLKENEVGYFLPLRGKVVVHKGRRRKTLLPLFTGYVFFRAGEEARYTALTSNRIAGVIEVIDQSQLTRQLLRVHQALASGEKMDTHPQLQRGTRVRVTGGALMGLEGVITRKRGVTKLLLNVDILGQAAAVEIDADLLELVE